MKKVVMLIYCLFVLEITLIESKDIRPSSVGLFGRITISRICVDGFEYIAVYQNGHKKFTQSWETGDTEAQPKRCKQRRDRWN